MKIKAEDKEKLFAAIDRGVKGISVDAIRKHRAQKLGIDTEKRFRWDLVRISGTFDIVCELYAYLTDDHIDTALKQYVKLHPEYSN